MGAPAPLVAATRADDRAHGVGRSPAPLCVQRCRARDERRFTKSEDGQLQGGDGVLRDVRGLRCGGRWPAAVSRGCAAAGAGSTAQRETDRRPCAFGPVASRRCAADGGTVGGRAARTVLRVAQTAEQLV